MMKLNKLLENVGIKTTIKKNIKRITSNINYVDEESIFIPYKGSKFNSYEYVEKALALGAIVIGDYYYEHDNYFSVFDNVQIAGTLTQALYAFPSNRCKVIGVSGTNGKSSTAYFIKCMLRKASANVLLIGTDGIFYNEDYISENQTTPSYEVLGKLFSKFDGQCEYIVMEVSSHALVQKRISGISFDMIIYTNIGHDHLDYHSSFFAYKSIKLELIHYLKSNGVVLLNCDDIHLKTYLDFINHQVLTFGEDGDYQVNEIEYLNNKLSFKINNQPYSFKMMGLYNAYNLCAAYACVDFFHKQASELILSIKGNKGRMEVVYDQDILVIVDYAHTLEAFIQLGINARTLKQQRNGEIWIVFGLGGNRDCIKRPKIGAAVTCFDHIIITSDNNRYESFDNISKDIIKGIKSSSYKRIENRSEAIKYALLNAHDNDIIIIAGKGYEAYQQIRGQKIPYSDYEEIEKYLKER